MHDKHGANAERNEAARMPWAAAGLWRRARCFDRMAEIGAMILFAAVIASQAAQADEVYLLNGDRITGTVKGIEDGNLVFETASFGEIKIPATDVATINTDDVVTVELQDGGYVTGVMSSSEDGKIVLRRPEETTAEFAYSDFKAIHPGDEIPVPEFAWSGRVNVGANSSSGNTENEAINADFEIEGRGEDDRLTFLGEFNWEWSKGTETADDQRLAGQYDGFVTEHWYVYVNGRLERNDFQDLNLRTAVGPGVGYQFFDTEAAQLRLEGGASYVNEDFDEAPDEESISGRWALSFDMFLIDEVLQVFHKQVGLVDLEDTGDILLITRQGVRIPLRNNFNVSAQFNWDHNTRPSPGREKADTSFILSAGYSF